MYEPMTANTLAEAADWLAEATGERWTPKRVLDVAIAKSGGAKRSCISVVPPRFTPFGFYEHVPTTDMTIFRRLELNCRFPLLVECATDIFDHGDVRISSITAQDEAGSNCVCIEPAGSFVNVTAEMLRLGRTELIALLHALQSDAALPSLPPLTIEAQRQKSGAAAGDYETTWWSLRLLATENDWPQQESRALISRVLDSLDEWNGDVVRRLLSGPASGNREHIPVRMGNTLGRRERVLDPEIKKAMTLAIDPTSAQSVFAELVKLANQQFGCLLEAVDGEVKYTNGDAAVFFSFKNLRDRMRRDKTR